MIYAPLCLLLCSPYLKKWCAYFGGAGVIGCGHMHAVTFVGEPGLGYLELLKKGCSGATWESVIRRMRSIGNRGNEAGNTTSEWGMFPNQGLCRCELFKNVVLVKCGN